MADTMMLVAAVFLMVFIAVVFARSRERREQEDRDRASQRAKEQQAAQDHKRVERIDALERQQHEVSRALHALEGEGITRRENALVLPERLLFDSGRAEIKVEGGYIISAIARKLAVSMRENESVRVIVAGHTDSVPIRTAEFPSNWELSTRRATNLLRMLVDDEPELPLGRIAAGGYADTQPLPDTLPENARNRRVEVRVEVVTERLLATDQ